MNDEIHTSQFEAIKSSMKQDKNGYVMSLVIHPDDVPEEIVRDFVGARYQVVMVRLQEDGQPMNRKKAHERDPVRSAAILCNDEDFSRYLEDIGELIDGRPEEIANWMRAKLNIESRSELRNNNEAAKHFWRIKEDFYLWTMTNA